MVEWSSKFKNLLTTFHNDIKVLYDYNKPEYIGKVNTYFKNKKRNHQTKNGRKSKKELEIKSHERKKIKKYAIFQFEKAQMKFNQQLKESQPDKAANTDKTAFVIETDIEKFKNEIQNNENKTSNKNEFEKNKTETNKMPLDALIFVTFFLSYFEIEH